MNSLAVLDWIILSLYGLFVVAVGIYAGREEKNTDDYFLGGRKMPWWAVMVSIYATSLSALTFIGVPGAAYSGNYYYLLLGVGDFVGRILIIALLLGAYYRARVTTVYQLLGQRFGPRSRDAGTSFFLVTRLLASGVRLAGCAIAMAVVFQLPLKTAIVLISATALIYTMAGGIKAVIWTDMAQFILFMAAAGIALFTIIFSLPNGWSDFYGIAMAHDKFKVFTLSFSAESQNYWLNLKGDDTFLLGLMYGCLGTFAALGTDQDLVQRMLTCEKAEESKKALLLTAILNFPITLLFLGVGTALFVYYRYHIDTDVLWYMAHGQTDKIFPHFIKTVLAPGLRGILVAGLFAAAMSSLDSALNALASTAYIDIYQRYINPNTSEKDAVKISRRLVAFFALVLALLAMLFSQTESILWLGFQIVGYTYGGLLGIFLLAVLTKSRGHDIANVIAMVSSVFVVIFLTTPNLSLGFPALGEALHGLRKSLLYFTGMEYLPWKWSMIVGTAWTFIIGCLFATEEKGKQ